MAERVFSVYLLYLFLRKLTTPFDQWKAYKLGIIDSNGNILKKRSNLKTAQEKEAFNIIDLFVLKIKVLLEKVPGGKSKLASFIAGLYFVKECYHTKINTLKDFEKWDDESFIEGFEDFIFSENINVISEEKTIPKSIFSKYGLDLNEIDLSDLIEYSTKYPELKEYTKYFSEDAPVNSVGGGGIAGLNGDDIPVYPRKNKKKILKRTDF